MATFFRAVLMLSPLIVFWAAAGRWPGALAAAALAVAMALLARRRGLDATLSVALAGLIAAAVPALLLDLPPVAVQSAVTLLAGFAMLLGSALERPWTAAASAPDWPGMAAHPLFLRVNQGLSALWGLVLLGHAVAIYTQAGPIAQWAPTAVAGVLSLTPKLLVPWLLQRRLRQADPSAWTSPLLDADRQPGELDVAIVGAGLGGLTAAALLARAGARVSVYEQHDKPGGFCHCWEGVQGVGGELLRFRFDAGVHDISGCYPGGTVRNLLARLDLDDALEWRRLDRGFIDDGGRWDVPRDWEAFTQALAGRFPGHEPALHGLLADIRQIYEDMFSTAQARGGVPGLPGSVQGMVAFARQHPLALRWMEQPFAALLDHHRVPVAARTLLLALAGYLTHDERTLRVREYVPLFGYFLHGGHYPVGGSGALTQWLADSVRLDGGEIHLGIAVERVLVGADGCAAGLLLRDGREIRARAVIVNGDMIAFARSLLPGQDWPRGFRRTLAALQPAASMFMVHLGIRGELPPLPPVLHLHDANGGVEMVLPSVVDPSAAPPGYHTVELMRLVSPQEAAGWFEHRQQTDATDQRHSQAYQERKARIAQGMIAAASRVIPQLRERIVFQREASPLTYRRYGFSTQGAIYGVQGAFGQVKRRSPVRGLVFAGAMTRGPGVEPAMMSGAEAADALVPGLLAERRRLPAPAPRSGTRAGTLNAQPAEATQRTPGGSGAHAAP